MQTFNALAFLVPNAKYKGKHAALETFSIINYKHLKQPDLCDETESTKITWRTRREDIPQSHVNRANFYR